MCVLSAVRKRKYFGVTRILVRHLMSCNKCLNIHELFTVNTNIRIHSNCFHTYYNLL